MTRGPPRSCICPRMKSLITKVLDEGQNVKVLVATPDPLEWAVLPSTRQPDLRQRRRIDPLSEKLLQFGARRITRLMREIFGVLIGPAASPSEGIVNQTLPFLYSSSRFVSNPDSLHTTTFMFLPEGDTTLSR